MWGKILGAVKEYSNVIIAAFTIVVALIYHAQLNATRLDQRAWVLVTAADGTTVGEGTDAMTVMFPTAISNSGKTPAFRSITEIVAAVIKNGEAPNFSFDRPNLHVEKGVIWPNESQKIYVSMMTPFAAPGAKSGAVTLSRAEQGEFADGTDYWIIYARSSYHDVFGKNHWMYYCHWYSPVPDKIDASKCIEYNAADSDW